MVIKFILVMISLIIVDILWAVYIVYSSKKQAIKAAFASSGIMLLGMYSTVSYIHDIRLGAAAIIGAFIGTYISLKFLKKDE